MTDLKAQKQMTADVFDAGKSRVWFDPKEQAEVTEAITREDTRELVDEGTTRAKDIKGNLKGRVHERAAKRSYGYRKGTGPRKGRSGARQNKKDAWASRIRAQCRRLEEPCEDGTLNRSQYRTLYSKVSGGESDSVDRLEACTQNSYQVEIQ